MMRSLARAGRASATLLLGLSCLFAAACSRDDGSQADEAMLRIEHVEPYYGSAVKSLDAVAAVVARDYGSGTQGDLATLRQAVEASFTIDPAMERTRRDLAAVPVGDADLSALPAAADAFGQAAKQVEEASKADFDKAYSEAEAAFGQRADKQQLEDLARAMAISGIELECTLRARRLQQAAALRWETDIARLTALDDEGIAAFADDFVKTTREQGDMANSPFRDELVEAMALRNLAMVLLKLPEDHLKVLKAFYAGEVGQAKRDALLKSFAAQNDVDSRRMIIAYLEKLRRPA